MSGGRSWTTGEVRHLHEMRAQRMKTREIALILDRTEDAIYSFLRYSPASGRPADSKPTKDSNGCSYGRFNDWRTKARIATDQLLTAIQAAGLSA